MGENDAHLRALEELLDCDISLRGNQLTLEGTAAEVERGEALVERAAGAAAVRAEPRPGHARAGGLAQRRPPATGPRDLGKIVSDVILEHRGRRIRPKTVNQKAYVDAIRTNTITFGIGPAGTGKTYLAMAMATAALLVGRRGPHHPHPAGGGGGREAGLPARGADGEGRPLPAPPVRRPVRHDGHRAAHRAPERGTIEVAPLAYMRGRTLNDSLIILDEAQNTSPEQMKMFLTRLGFGAKMIVTGDITQIDLPRGQHSGLVNVREVLASIPDIAFVYFDSQDVVRHKLVQDIVSAYKEYGEQHQPVRKATSRGPGGTAPRRPGSGRRRPHSQAATPHGQVPSSGCASGWPTSGNGSTGGARWRFRTGAARLPAWSGSPSSSARPTCPRCTASP